MLFMILYIVFSVDSFARVCCCGVRQNEPEQLPGIYEFPWLTSVSCATYDDAISYAS